MERADMTPLPALRSIPEMDALAAWLHDRYGLQAPVDCSLIKWNWNDTYEVSTGQGRFVLRIYGLERHDRAAIDYELALLAHLKRSGVHACAPVNAAGGQARVEIPLAEGHRYGALFEHAEGKVRAPTSPELAAQLGLALARLHTAADAFVAKGSREALDLEAVVEGAAPRLAALAPGKTADADFVRDLAARLSTQLRALPQAELDQGAIHGDPFSNNASIDASGRVHWFDFDECRPDYRAMDLTVPYWIGRSGQPAVWDAFLNAYRSVRELSDADLQAIAPIFVAQLIHTLTELPTRRAPIGGSELIRPLVAARLGQLRGVAGWVSD
jgi:Ser/Thr protein kinase RdoA (MazF antagonist)